MDTTPEPKRRSPRIDADKKCRTAAKQLAGAVAERVWGLAVAPDGKEYYYHLATNATAWSLPAGAILQADGETYVSEQQHRISPRSSPKAKPSPSTRSPKGGSPKARVAAATGQTSPNVPLSEQRPAAATGSPMGPKSRAAVATGSPLLTGSPMSLPKSVRVDAAAATTPPGKAPAAASGAAAHAAGRLAVEVRRLRPLLQESRADLLALKAEQDRSVASYADPYVPGPRTVRMGYASQPHAQGSLPRGAKYCACAVHVYASGVPYVPRTVAPQVASLQAALLGMVSRALDAQALSDVGSTELHMEADAAEAPQDAAEVEAAEEEAVEEEAVKAEEEVAGEEEQEQEQKLEQEQEQEITAVQAARRLRTLLASVQEQLQHSEGRCAESAAELQAGMPPCQASHALLPALAPPPG